VIVYLARKIDRLEQLKDDERDGKRSTGKRAN
jgi:hypothetical protein